MLDTLHRVALARAFVCGALFLRRQCGLLREAFGQALRGTWPAGHALSIGAASADKDGTLRSRFVAVCCVGESGVPVVRSRLLRAAAHGRV